MNSYKGKQMNKEGLTKFLKIEIDNKKVKKVVLYVRFFLYTIYNSCWNIY